jgi:signal transduction histidine kinase
MHPVVRDEIYRVGYEAIRNARTHSRGSRLEVELKYGHDLALHVKDNGVGIDPTIGDHGKEDTSVCRECASGLRESKAS